VTGRNKKCKHNFLLSSSWEESTCESGLQISFMNVIGEMRLNSAILYIIVKVLFRFLEVTS